MTVEDWPRSPVLDLLDDDARTDLMQRAVRRVLARGEILYLGGDPGSRIHIVAAGVLKLSGRNPSGNEILLGLVLPGELVGDIAALDGGDQPVDAVALAPAVVWGVDADAFAVALQRSGPAANRLATDLAVRLRALIRAQVERSSASVHERLAGRLMHLAELLGRRHGASIELELPMGQADLGSLAGMCRESACKTLQDFRTNGLIRLRGRKLRIERPDVLERISCAGLGATPFRSERGAARRRSRSSEDT